MESYAETWGNAITETAAGSGQVGIKTQNLDLDLNVKDHGILIVVTSQYGGGDDKWGGLIYLPKGSLMLGEVPFATTPATTAFTAKQFAHSTDGFWQMVTADAT